jgi:Protein of unknown function (DUF1587)
VVLRRLNRVECENTVRDLLGINISVKDQLPADGSADGFDNAGAANHTSSILMSREPPLNAIPTLGQNNKMMSNARVSCDFRVSLEYAGWN